MNRTGFAPALQVAAGSGARDVVGLAKGNGHWLRPPPYVHPLPAGNVIRRMIENRP
jgi:hypothetical protein